jgi:hypothetical protein
MDGDEGVVQRLRVLERSALEQRAVDVPEEQ